MAVVYLAGKILTTFHPDCCNCDWRLALLDQRVHKAKELEAFRWVQDPNLLLQTIAPGVSYNGPFCAGQHGTDDGESREMHERLRRRCVSAIRGADFIFANLSDPTCHGTLWELGFATALGKKIAVWNPHEDVWFAARGTQRLRDMSLADAFLRVCDAWYPEPVPGDSPIEQAFAKAWRALNGVYPPAQVQIGAYRVDFLIRDLVVECDGHDYHSTKEQKAADAKRDRELMAQGYRVCRFTGRELHADPGACAAQALRLAGA